MVRAKTIPIKLADIFQGDIVRVNMVEVNIKIH
jgi:hypothetical protein